MSLSSELEAMHKNRSCKHSKLPSWYGCIMSRGLPGGLILGSARKPGILQLLHASVYLISMHLREAGRQDGLYVTYKCGSSQSKGPGQIGSLILSEDSPLRCR